MPLSDREMSLPPSVTRQNAEDSTADLGYWNWAAPADTPNDMRDSTIREVDIATPSSISSDVRVADLTDTNRCRHCDNAAATWRFWIRRHLCDSCKSLPEYRTISRSAAMQKYDLTLEQVLHGQDSGMLQVFYSKNPHNTGSNAGKDNKSAWMKIYFVTELEAFVSDLHYLSNLHRSRPGVSTSNDTGQRLTFC